IFNGALYVGGLYYRVDSGTYATVSRFDGVSWSDVPQTQSPVTVLEALNGQLYACTTLPAGVYRLDGAQWTKLGFSPDHDVKALGYYGGYLIAGGEFTTFFTQYAFAGLARWSGAAWVPFGTGVGPAGSS